jgi:hypothetical protein
LNWYDLTSTPQKTKGREAPEMEMNTRSLVALSFALAFASVTPKLHSQAAPPAKRNADLQIGVAVSDAQTDEYSARTQGASGFVDIDLTRHLGIEAEVHEMGIITPNDFVENSALAGIRYRMRFGPLEPYGKAMVGYGKTYIQAPSKVTLPGTPGTYFMYAGGAGIDIRLTHHIVLRCADIEFQLWQGFPPNGLSPVVASAGLAWRFN